MYQMKIFFIYSALLARRSLEYSWKGTQHLVEIRTLPTCTQSWNMYHQWSGWSKFKCGYFVLINLLIQMIFKKFIKFKKYVNAITLQSSFPYYFLKYVNCYYLLSFCYNQSKFYFFYFTRMRKFWLEYSSTFTSDDSVTKWTEKVFDRFNITFPINCSEISGWIHSV